MTSTGSTPGTFGLLGALLALSLFVSTGCTLVGAGVGAALGARADRRDPARGALIGATAGAVTGAVFDHLYLYRPRRSRVVTVDTYGTFDWCRR